jgi:hypothetical protein
LRTAVEPAKPWKPSHEWVPAELEPVDLLLLGSHLAYGGAPNRTDGDRSSIYATYHAKSEGEDLKAKYHADRWENFPPDHG